MEQGGQNGSRTDHDRVPGANGGNGAGGKSTAPEGRRMAAAGDDGPVNGGDVSPRSRAAASTAPLSRMNDLPKEIFHITQGFVPLSLLLTRLAQATHNSLQDKIAELAKMPLPAAAVNGNANLVAGGGPDDSSAENLRRKRNLAGFAQDLHGKWLKALVITEWSRKSEMVSKLIDLKFHIYQQRILYDTSLDNIVSLKRDLTFARMPSPDLKTALQVLSTGKAPWIPDLNYLDPPPLTPGEQLKWINDLNTLLSLRLSLEDFDKIPFHFRSYEIGSGRVTFKVDGEFEVDLTIADEDFEKQFWFIDFRYAFTPAAATLSASLRAYLEGCVNEALRKDGLAGCYQFLHEFVLTSNINELKRQAMQLSRSSWSGTLAIEPLNRALAVQYWTSRTAATGTKSWILVAVNSGRKLNGRVDPKATSFIEAKWYQDGNEVKDAGLELNVGSVSAESLLTHVVGRHIDFILTGIHDKLSTASRFKNREVGMVLDVCKTDAAASSLSMQVEYRDRITLVVEPMAGAFSIRPPSRFTVQPEHQLNSGKNTADNGAQCLESVRCAIMEDELNRRGSSMGWAVRKSPLTAEEMKSVRFGDWSRAIWLQKEGWGANWFMVVLLGLGGDEWWLLEANRDEGPRVVKLKARLPLHGGHPEQSEAFWNNLALFTTGIMMHSVDARELLRKGVKSKPSENTYASPSQPVRLPSVEIALSALFPLMTSGSSEAGHGHEGDGTAANAELLSLMQRLTGKVTAPRQAWAEDTVLISFKGIQSPWPRRGEADAAGSAGEELICVSDAVIKVRKRAMFRALEGMVDHDVSYNPSRGEFSLRIRRRVGEAILDVLRGRIKTVDRFVNFLEAVTDAGDAIATESTLKRVAFRYGAKHGAKDEGPDTSKPWRVSLDLSGEDIAVEVDSGNPHLRTVDFMGRLVNSHGGIGALMFWLSMSLHALIAVDAMEAQWACLEAQRQGRLEITTRAIGWIKIGYSAAGVEARAVLELRVRPRRGEAWWHVWRSDAGASASPDDEFNKALRPVWGAKGDGWLGLATGAAGRPDGGVAAMLLAMDDAVRGAVVGTGGEPSAPPKEERPKQGDAHKVLVLE